MTVNGGTVESTDSSSAAIAVHQHAGLAGMLEVNGGNVAGGEYGIYALSGADITLNGGTFSGTGAAISSTTPVNDLLAEGNGYFDDDDMPVTPADDQTELAGPVTVHGTAIVAEVTVNGETVQYASIEGAWRAANNAGSPAILTLLADVTVESLDVTGGADITFRGGEHTLTVTEVIAIGDPSFDASEWAYTSDKLTVESGKIDGGIYMFGGSLAVTGGTIECDGNAVICYWGDVTVDSGAVIAHGTGAIAVHDGSTFGDTDVIGRVTVNGGTVSGRERGILCAGSATVNGGTVTGGECGILSENGRLTVNGGTVTGGAGIQVGEGYRFPDRADGGTVAITGGTIKGTAGPGLDLRDNSAVTLSGGTFSGTEGAIHCEPYRENSFFVSGSKLTVSELLAQGYGYFDSADKPVTPTAEQMDLTGPVTVHKLAAQAPAPTAGAGADKKAPSTGDDTALLLWLTVLAGCAAALAVLGLRRRRN